MSRKGISLPIEMIVIIAIAVLVLVVIAAVFIQNMSFQNPEVSRAYADLCSRQITSCGVEPGSITATGVYDLNNDKALDPTTTLIQVCALKGITDPVTCRKSCGCPS